MMKEHILQTVVETPEFIKQTKNYMGGNKIMSKLGESLLRGLNEALSYAKKEKTSAKVHKVSIPKKVNVKSIRLNLHLSQQEFANRYGFSVRTLEKWEQGVRQPEGAARAYLVVIAFNHRAVELALKRQSQ